MRYVYLAAFAVLGALAPSSAFGQTSSLSVTNYQFVGEQRVTLTSSKVTYRGDLVNADGPLASVTATLTSLNTSSFTAVPGQNTLTFAPVPSHSQTTSSNTFTILVNRTVVFDPAFSQLQWNFQTVSQAPSANAGPGQMATVGGAVTLNGSGSTNPSGIGTLTYSWAFTSRPAGSASLLSNPSSVMPTFVPDMAGAYVIALTVSNGAASSTASVTVATNAPPPPVANAGPNQTVNAGATVVLNGGGSTSGSGNPLTYAWTMTFRPAGSSAALGGASTVSPLFVADKPGVFTAQLVVNDGIASSALSSVTITTQIVKPVANAGPGQTASINSPVQLNGSGSTDANGLPLTYQWNLIALPAGSAAAIGSPTAVNPAFTPDRQGNYVAQLIVNNGTLSSTPSTATITTQAPLAPTANAGTNQTVAAGGTVVTLNGSGTDPQNLPLTYQWTLISKPSGSAAGLSSAVIPNPAFTADLAGAYVAQLIVNDGYLSSAPVTITISTTCSQPTANAGPNQNVIVGATVTLNGSASGDACRDPLIFSWTLTTRPAGSAAAFSGANTVSPSFASDVVGTYVAQLIVNNGFTPSNPVTVTITVATTPTITLTPNPLTVGNNSTGAWKLTLSSPAGASGQVINLSSGNISVATVPATVTVAAGSATASISVTPGSIGSTSVTASASGYTTGSAAVNVVAVAISLPAGTPLGLNQSAAFDVTLSQPAPAGGVTVTLASGDATKVTVSPTTVTIAAGATAPAAQPQVTGAGLGSASITATSPGYTTGTGQVQVAAAFSFAPGSLTVPGNSTQNLTLNLTGGSSAPAGGLTVNLISDNTGVATVVSSVTFAANASSVTVPVTGVAQGSAIIHASAAGIPDTTALILVQIFGQVVAANGTVGLGQSAAFPVSLSVAAPAGGTTVNLSSGDPTKVTVAPASVFIPANATAPAAQPQVTGVSLGAASITASASGYTTATQTITPTATVGFSPGSITIIGTATQNLTLALSAPSPTAVTVNLTSSDATKATVPSTVTFAANATSATVAVTGVAPGSATIHASALPNIADATASVTVAPTVINGPASPITVGLGQSAAFPVSLAAAAPAGGVTLTLTSADPTKVTVSPASVTILAGATTPAAQPQVTGVAFGSIAVTASSTGYTSGSQTVQVTGSIAFTPASLTIYGANTQNLTLTLSGPAPAGGVTVNLTSNNAGAASVPATATFTANSTTVNVPVTGISVGLAAIHASASPNLADASAAVTVASDILLPAVSLQPGQQVNFPVTLANPAPAGGVFVTLASSDTTKVTLSVSNVFIPQGSTVSNQPKVTGVNVGSAVITATASGLLGANQTVPVGVGQTLSFQPSSITLASNAIQNLALNLSSPAPIGGVTVNLTSTNPAAATVPATVTIAAGSATVNVPVNPAGPGSTVLHASAANIADTTATVTVQGPLSISVPVSTSMGLGQPAAFAVTLPAAAPAGGVTVNLSSADATKVTVPASVFIAAGATAPATQPQVTGAGIGSATVTASATGYTSGSGAVTVTAPAMSFAGSPLAVNAGSAGNLTLNLTGGVAPAGGLTVSLSSSDTSKATVPATVNFPAGAASATIAVNGVAVGSATITASAAGIAPATAAVNVASLSIAVANTTVGLGQTAILTVSLPSPAPAGGVTVNLVSGDVTKVTVPASVFIATGAMAPATQPQVTGMAIGSAVIVGSAAGFVSGSGTATVPAPTMSFSPASLAVNTGSTGTLTLNLSGGKAPAGGLTVSLASDNTSVATMPVSVTFAAGSASAGVTVTGVANGSAAITASATGISSVTATVTVSTPASVPFISISGVSIGQGLQASITLSLLAIDPRTGMPVPSPAPAGGLRVNVTSLDPSKVLVAGRQSDAGSQQVTFGVPQGLSTVGGIYLQGLANSGTATISASGLTFATGQATVTLTPSGFVLIGPNGTPGTPSSFTTNVGAAKSTLTVNAARLDASSNFAEIQQVRGGSTVAVSLSNSNPGAGAAVSPVVFNGGDDTVTTLFTPTGNNANAGSTTLTAAAPAGFGTPASGTSVTVNVQPQTLTLPNVTVGKNLETASRVSGATPGLQIAVTSNNPGLVKLSTTPGGEGSASIVLLVPAGRTVSPDFYVYGLDNSGSATYTAAASGFASGAGTVTLAPSGFVIAGPGGVGSSAFVAFSASTPVNVYPARLDSSLNYVETQALAGGQSASVGVASSNTAVGTISVSPVTISGGSSGATTQFQRGTSGSSVLTAATPTGFSTPAAPFGKVTANVLAQSFSLSCDGVTVGQNLQTVCTVALGQAAPAGGLAVTLTSNNPASLLLAAAATGGAGSVTVTIPGGGMSASYFAQALAGSGSTTHTASAPGFTSRDATIALAPSGIVIAGPFGLGVPFFFSSVSGGPVTVTLFMAVLNSDPASCSPQTAPCYSGVTQALRGGLASVQVSLSSSNPGVGGIASPVAFTGGSSTADAQFTPAGPGSATVSVSAPAGFTASSNGTLLTTNVTP